MEKIQMVDLHAQYNLIKAVIDKAISEVITKKAFISGPFVQKFEESWAKACNTDYCVGTSSGTTSLELVLKCWNLPENSEIICPTHTFIATAEAIVNTGHKPVFADIDPETGLICLDSLKSKLTEKTSAVIIVDLYGQCADYYAVKNILDDFKSGIKILQDAAQSHLSLYKGRVVGSYCDAVSFSFYPGKNLGAYGDAGAVVTSDKELYLKMKMLLNHGRKEKYTHEMIGVNFRMDGLQGNILSAKLPHLQKWTDQRRELAKYYIEKLEGSKFRPLKVLEHNNPVYHCFVVRLPENLQEEEAKNKLMSYLSENKISSAIHYPIPLHKQPAFLNYLKEEISLPKAEKLARENFSLPMYPELTKKQIDYIVEKLLEFEI